MGLFKAILTKFKIRNPEQTTPRQDDDSEVDMENDKRNAVLCRKLYKAARGGDWKTASEIFTEDPALVTAKITEENETALHVVVGEGHKKEMLRNLIDLMPEDTLGLTNGNDETALSVAAIVGNVDAAEMLVRKNKYLPYIWSGNASPLHRAAQYGHRDIVSFLLDKTKAHTGKSPYANLHGVLLLKQLIMSRLYDLAVRVIIDYPVILEAMPRYNHNSLLMEIANQPSSFFSGTSFNPWQHVVYRCLPSKKSEAKGIPSKKSKTNTIVDNQNQSEDQQHTKLSCCIKIGTGCGNLCARLGETILKVLRIKKVLDIKKSHKNVLDVVNHICVAISHLGHDEARHLFKEPFLLAATNGIKEIVSAIVTNFPSAIWFNQDGYSLFHLAVLNRREDIFSLIEDYKSDVNQIIRNHIDKDQNNLLHLAAKLAPSHRLSLISGAVLQMQDELKWFEKVKQIVAVHYIDNKNKDDRTPEMVFIEEHKDLVTEAADWMHKTASACSTAATLIATVVFAAAITVPGGNSSETGLPVLLQRKVFTMFAISDATALFSSTASLLMFLSILTSRYSHQDFLLALPTKLIIGLLTLFLAMASLIFAFSTTLYLVLGYGKMDILITMYTLSGVVVLLFLIMFSSLVGKMIWSTYGTTIRYICRPLYGPLGWLFGTTIRYICSPLGWLFGTTIHYICRPLWWLYGATIRYICRPLRCN